MNWNIHIKKNSKAYREEIEDIKDKQKIKNKENTKE